MPLIDLELRRGDTGDNVRELHAQLIISGAVVETGEQNSATFGPSTLTAVRAFRQRYGLPIGDAVDLPTARLMHAASAYAGYGGRAALRTAVRESAAAAAADSGHPQELYWLARYAILAGDHDTAQSIATQIPAHGGIVGLVDPILGLPEHLAPGDPGQPPVAPQPADPQLPYPENFYAYHRDFYSVAVIDDVRQRIAAVAQPPRSANQAYPASGDLGSTLIQAAVSWLNSLEQWQLGNLAYQRQKYADAVAAYDACQAATCDFFSKTYTIDLGAGTLRSRLVNLIVHVGKNETAWAPLWAKIRWRRGLLSLDELAAWDWPEHSPDLHIPRKFDPSPLIGELPPPPDFGLGFLQHYFRRGEFGYEPAALEARQNELEARLITLAFVLVPLARAEANRARRQFDAAIEDLQWVLNSPVIRQIFPPPGEGGPIRQVRARIACEFIEVPFARLLLAETMLDKADAEHKARIVADPAPPVAEYQNLKAAQTYLAIKEQFKNEGEYVALVDAAHARLAHDIQVGLAAGVRSARFQLASKDVYVPTLAAVGPTLAGLDRRVKLHEPLLKFTAEGPPVLRETNPRVYAALLTATARLAQLKAGFNYLGYLDTYVPPWRFHFLLDRARYFAEHAKSVQREYLNFLSNAEREEFQELSVVQNVEMEKANIRVETARVNLAKLEIESVKASQEQAGQVAENARNRFKRYAEFDERADALAGTGESADWSHAIGSLSPSVWLGGALDGMFDEVARDVRTAGRDFFTGGFASSQIDRALASEQRDVEKFNLELAILEAEKMAEVAGAQVAVATGSLEVAALQRQAALLRHELALQSLQFLRNRALGTEQWYRLAARIRSVGETYLRYAVELAFLAEQAYEFEADQRLNVIRFDYDLSEVGDFLAADFLLRDLDTLERDLIVTQRQRQQQVRYVLSMARECPAALQEIRDRGEATFSLPLQEIEKRFPGLYNVRIGAVDLLPVALMDSTRFSLELTHLGTSQLRLKTQPDTVSGTPSPSPLNTSDMPVPPDGWLPGLQQTWPIKLRVSGPETVVFSGLTRQDASAIYAFAAGSQRHPFEGLGAASAWKVDFNARDNQVVPGTLADLLLTFTLAGYHHPDLRRAVDTAPRAPAAVTAWLSGRTTFPDSLYEFHRSGRMAWNVSRGLLTVADTVGAVRNAGVLLSPAPSLKGTTFGRLMSRCEVRLRIAPGGELNVLNELPKQIAFESGGAANPLTVTARTTIAGGATKTSWDFGDGSARQEGLNVQHAYARPGRYIVTLRVVRAGRLSEFRAEVTVSRAHADRVSPPLVVLPAITTETAVDVPAGLTRVIGEVAVSADEPSAVSWRVGPDNRSNVNRTTFDLPPGDHTLVCTSVRAINARFYCTQRQPSDELFVFRGLALSSNRRFATDGTETTGAGENPPATSLTTHLFADVLSPVDEWTLDLPLDANPCLLSVSSSDVEQYALDAFGDAVLILEYETSR